MENVKIDLDYLPSVKANHFAELWNQFDSNESGFIEGNELNSFFYEFSKKLLKKEPTVEEHQSIKKLFMSAYDKSGDGKISLNEFAKMVLPEDEAFILLFRRTIPLDSSVTFMRIWRKYDKNRSGFIDVKELKAFIADYVHEAGATVSTKELNEYAQTIMKLFDRNEDKLLDLQDMARLINVSENFLLQFKIQDGSPAERRKDFEKIFAHYDQSENGVLEGVELDGFVKDMMELIRGPLTAKELEELKTNLLEHIDENHDGRIQKSELAVCLGVHLR